ncbi:MAG: hypothetical protein IPJ98_20295, partial [Bryobacterales bacterium]|nr:hypothetical protein [Bryobacterales bacterium]
RRLRHTPQKAQRERLHLLRKWTSAIRLSLNALGVVNVGTPFLSKASNTSANTSTRLSAIAAIGFEALLATDHFFDL